MDDVTLERLGLAEQLVRITWQAIETRHRWVYVAGLHGPRRPRALRLLLHRLMQVLGAMKGMYALLRAAAMHR